MKAMIPGRKFELRKAQAAVPLAAIRAAINPGGGCPGGGRQGGYPPGGGPYGQNASQDIEDKPKIQPLIHPSRLLTIPVALMWSASTRNDTGPHVAPSSNKTTSTQSLLHNQSEIQSPTGSIVLTAYRKSVRSRRRPC